MIPDNLKTKLFSSSYHSIFPDVICKDCCYMIGSNINGWNDLYESVYVFCCQNRIPNIVFIWSNLKYKHYSIKDYDWTKYFKIPDNLKKHLIENFNPGYELLISKSLRQTLIYYSSIKTIQVFSNGDGEYEKISESRLIPTFNYDNTPSIDIVREQNINLFINSGRSVNISKNNEIEYITKLIRYSTAHCAIGCIFEVNSNRGSDLQTIINVLTCNIVNSIRNAKFKPEQKIMSKLLIKPSFKQNNNLIFLNEITNLIMFVNNLKNFPDVLEFFGIVLNIEDLFNFYNPYYYIKEIIKHVNVEVVQISNSWLENLVNDNYVFIYLHKVCQLCILMDIKIIITI